MRLVQASLISLTSLLFGLASQAAELSTVLVDRIELPREYRSEVNLNLQLHPNVTARGSVSSDGETGLGIFFERDY